MAAAVCAVQMAAFLYLDESGSILSGESPVMGDMQVLQFVKSRNKSRELSKSTVCILTQPVLFLWTLIICSGLFALESQDTTCFVFFRTCTVVIYAVLDFRGFRFCIISMIYLFFNSIPALGTFLFNCSHRLLTGC